MPTAEEEVLIESSQYSRVKHGLDEHEHCQDCKQGLRMKLEILMITHWPLPLHLKQQTWTAGTQYPHDNPTNRPTAIGNAHAADRTQADVAATRGTVHEHSLELHTF